MGVLQTVTRGLLDNYVFSTPADVQTEVAGLRDLLRDGVPTNRNTLAKLDSYIAGELAKRALTDSEAQFQSVRATADGTGSAGIVRGSATHTGSVEWRLPDGTRLAYMGAADATSKTLTLATENGGKLNFASAPTIAGADIYTTANLDPGVFARKTAIDKLSNLAPVDQVYTGLRENAAWEIGQGLSGDRSIILDLHASGAPNAMDFSARLVRGAGVNGILDLINAGTGIIRLQSNAYTRITTQFGRVDIGAQNADHAHFSTDRPSYLFDKPVSVTGAFSATGGMTIGGTLTSTGVIMQMQHDGDKHLWFKRADGSEQSLIWSTPTGLRLRYAGGAAMVITAGLASGVKFHATNDSGDGYNASFLANSPGSFANVGFHNHGRQAAQLIARDGTIDVVDMAIANWVGMRAASFGSMSDYRLKRNVALMDNHETAAMLMSLEPRWFDYCEHKDATLTPNAERSAYRSATSDGGNTPGFLAHELQRFFPHAVSGYKDQLDSEGKPVHQSVDYSKMVPVLTSALQHALSKISDLEYRLSQLESSQS